MQEHTSKILIWYFLMILSLINDENPHVWDLITTPPWLETPRFSGQNYTCWWVIFLPICRFCPQSISRSLTRSGSGVLTRTSGSSCIMMRVYTGAVISNVLQTVTCRHIPGWPSSSTTWSTSRCCPAQWATGARRSGWGGQRTKSGSTGQHVHIVHIMFSWP